MSASIPARSIGRRFIDAMSHPEHGWKTTHFWGPVANWGLVAAAVTDAVTKPPDVISMKMTCTMAAYSAVFMRFAWMVQPRNHLLFACHLFNVGAQLYQLQRGYKHQLAHKVNAAVRPLPHSPPSRPMFSRVTLFPSQSRSMHQKQVQASRILYFTHILLTLCLFLHCYVFFALFQVADARIEGMAAAEAAGAAALRPAAAAPSVTSKDLQFNPVIAALATAGTLGLAVAGGPIKRALLSNPNLPATVQKVR